MCERHTNWLPLACSQLRDLACNPGICPDQELNWQSFGSQADAQSTEPYQPGLTLFLFSFSFFKRFYSFTFREREGRERGRETSMCDRCIDRLSLTFPQVETWPTTHACTLTGNQKSNLSVHRPALNPLSHTSQGQG